MNAMDDEEQVKARVRLASYLFGLCLVTAFALLWWGKFTGGDFVAFFGLTAVLCIAVGMAPYVEELSVGKYVVRLRQATIEAEVIVDRLNGLTNSFYQSMLAEYRKAPNDGPLTTQTANLYRFRALISDIGRLPDLTALEGSVMATVDALMVFQYRCVMNLHPEGLEAYDPFDDPPDPQVLADRVLDETTLSEAHHSFISRLMEREINHYDELFTTPLIYKTLLEQAIEAYRLLFDLRQELAHEVATRQATS